MNRDLITEASIELSQIDRYFRKNWMDEDYPTDNLWKLLQQVTNGLQEVCCE